MKYFLISVVIVLVGLALVSLYSASEKPPAFSESYDILAMGEGLDNVEGKQAYIFVVRRSTVPQADPRMLVVSRDKIWYDKDLPMGTLRLPGIFGAIHPPANVVVACNPPYYIGSSLVPATRPAAPIPR